MKRSSPGDPEGRRIALRKALLLEEAARVAECLCGLLERAEFNSTLVRELVQVLKTEEIKHLQRGKLKIESRRALPHRVTDPRYEGRAKCTLFIDESGKSAIEKHATAVPFFSIAGIVMTDEAIDAYCRAADRVKMLFWGRTDITFHEPEMRRRSVIYGFDNDEARQAEFDAAVNELLRNSEFTAFGVGVRKKPFEKEFLSTSIDPYLPTDCYALAIHLLLERVVDFLAYHSVKMHCAVTFESQGKKEDAEHQIQYALLQLNGTQWVSDADFRNWLEIGCDFVPKRGSHPTEIADILSRDIFEWTRSDCSQKPKFADVFREKVYCRSHGLRGTFGFKVFPDADIRDIIEQQRKECGATLEP